MTYTSHGHMIAGSPADPLPPKERARCGGPQICAKCALEESLWREQAALDSKILEADSKLAKNNVGIPIPKSFVSRPVRIEALQFNGTAGNAFDILDWMKSHGGEGTWQEAQEPWTHENGHDSQPGYPAKLTIHTLEGYMECVPGAWVVRGTENEFYPVKDSIFKKKYQEL